MTELKFITAVHKTPY